MSETNLMRRIQVALSEAGARLFRNNVAMAWAGSKGSIIKPHAPCVVTLMPDDVLLRNARPIHAGLCEGSSDLVGWNEVKITPDMVGLSVAIFATVEVKTPFGRLTKEQSNFLYAVRSSGGIAVVARSEEEALEGVCGFKCKGS